MRGLGCRWRRGCKGSSRRGGGRGSKNIQDECVEIDKCVFIFSREARGMFVFEDLFQGGADGPAGFRGVGHFAGAAFAVFVGEADVDVEGVEVGF